MTIGRSATFPGYVAEFSEVIGDVCTTMTTPLHMLSTNFCSACQISSDGMIHGSGDACCA